MLKQNLINFKELTLDIIEATEKEEYEKLDELLDKRKSIIDFLSTLKYSDEEFNNILKELDILELESNAKDSISQKLDIIRNELKIVKQNKQLSQYFDVEKAESILINKKI